VEARPPSPERRRPLDGAPPVADQSDPAGLVAAFAYSRTLQVGFDDAAVALAIAGVHERRGVGSHTIIAAPAEAADASERVEHLRRAGLADRVRVIVGLAELTLPELVRDGFEADFALIGGGKRFEEVFVEFLYLDRLLVTGGVMALADGGEAAASAVLRFVAEARAYELRSLPGAHLAVLRKLGRHQAPGQPVPRWTTAAHRNGDGTSPLTNASSASVTELPAATGSRVSALEPSAAREQFLARARAEELTRRVAELGAALIDAEQRVGELANARLRLKETELELDAVRHRLQLARSANRELEEQLETSQAAHQRAEHWLARIKSSPSWRLTAPLRAAKTLARSLLRR
jgi:hypothetical protein